MHTRRQMLRHSATLAGLLAGAGMLPPAALAAWTQAAFEAKSLPEVVRALGGGAPVESKEVTLTAPDVADNGAAVQLGLASSAAGARRLLLLVEKNPNVLAAVFELGDGVDASFVTRLKMAQSSNVYAVAMLADGRVLYAVQDIKVTLGGCGA
jgi:sulfur-oxidizing protein SoxY